MRFSVPAPKTARCKNPSGLSLSAYRQCRPSGFRPNFDTDTVRRSIFERDFQHGAVEIYDKQGKHLGEFDADTGEQRKPAKNGRTTQK
ncbi:MAG: colicin E3/pyocin S6 family cytotoxin [Pseudomonas helleri]|uniref:colicin E3/pyocin S6 family cytotoxin n=1 Tax=Pseudomonas helleri TaxID=1608996 RepID=UPI002B1FFBC3|nr:colicin E3/pyocin S6 family cytotoxin [Pseudomonas helleri]